MSVKYRNGILLAAAMLLAACIAGGGAARDKATGINPTTGSAIEVTALDTPMAELADVPAAATEPAALTEKRSDGAAAPAESSSAPADSTVSEGAEIAAPEAAPVVPQELKTEAQLACEKQGNLWAKAGKSSASACLQQLKDGGKRCVNGKQCQGECLARSMTCSPYQPLFGCNEILQDDGVRMTLCID